MTFFVGEEGKNMFDAKSDDIWAFGNFFFQMLIFDRDHNSNSDLQVGFSQVC